MTASTRGGYNGERLSGPTGGEAPVATNELAELASAIERQTAADDVYHTAVSALRLSRFSAPSDLVAVVYEPSLCVVAQGTKEVLLADETYRLDPPSRSWCRSTSRSTPGWSRQRRAARTLRFASRLT